MAGTLPASPEPTQVKFDLQTPVIKTTTISGKTRRVAMGIQYYTMTLRYGSMTSDSLRPLQAFLASQYGGYDSFQVVLPKISYRKATDTLTTPYATEATVVGSTSIKMTSSSLNKTALKAGDFFKFENHSKVYMANADWSTGSTGTSFLTFTPGLVTNVVMGEIITYDAVPFTVILDNEVQTFNHGIGGIATFDLELREVW
jgi:hypothetical protein